MQQQIEVMKNFVERGQAAQAAVDEIIAEVTGTKAPEPDRDLKFLEEMQERLEAFRNGDLLQGDYLKAMIEDWIDELKSSAG